MPTPAPENNRYQNTMKTLYILALSLLVSLAPNLTATAAEQTVSGRVIGGYRILPVPAGRDKINFTVYRGDYIKFSYNEQLGPQPFALPVLKYQQTITPSPEKSPFFKMKKAGTYVFTLGDRAGTLTVVELVRPNYTELTAAQAAELLKNIRPFILDVRTPREYKQFSIKGAHLLPIGQLQARIKELEAYKNDDVFVYCATGNRSTVASKILADAGFKRIYNLRYGAYDWARRGFPIVKH